MTFLQSISWALGGIGAGPLLAVLIADLQPRSDDGAHARAVFAEHGLAVWVEEGE